MTYLEKLYKFYANFALWRVKTLGLEYRYLLLLSNSRRMSGDIEDIVEAAREFVNKTHICDESQIFGSVWFFNNAIARKNRFSDKKGEILDYLRLPPICQGGNSLWSAVGASLEALETNDGRRESRMLVFTDGYDVEGDFGLSEVVQHNIEGLTRIADRARSGRIRVHFLALIRDERDRRFWRILAQSADEICDEVKWVTVIPLSEVGRIIEQFRNRHNQVQRDILRICTLENFGWRFLEKDFPPTRWYLYPGLALCMCLDKMMRGREDSAGLAKDKVVVSVLELQNTLSTFIERIVREESWTPTIQRVVDVGRAFDKERYSNWIGQDKFIDNYVNVVLEAMQGAGWVSPASDTTWVVREPDDSDRSVIVYLMENYFLSDIWKDAEELTTKRPKLGALMRKFFGGQPRPYLDDKYVRTIWPL